MGRKKKSKPRGKRRKDSRGKRKAHQRYPNIRVRQDWIHASHYVDEFIFWSTKKELVFDVHTASKFSHNLTIKAGRCILETAIKLALESSLSYILVIHGHNGKRKAWLKYLKKEYGDELKRWKKSNPGVSKLFLRKVREEVL